MFKHLFLPIIGLGLILSGCAPSELNRFEFAVAESLCDVDALAEEKKTRLASVNDSRASIRAHQNRTGTYEEETYTILEEKLRVYEADLEASYRFATQNCSVYARCLERQNHDEWSCKRTEERWSEAQGRFNDLILEGKRIDAYIITTLAKAKGKKKRCRHGDCHRDCGYRDCDPPKKSCCDTINNIFTDCCDD